MTQGNVLTPFLETRSFVQEAGDLQVAEVAATRFGSPFVSVYELDGESSFQDPTLAARATLAQELYDHEFEEALYELSLETRSLHEEHLASGSGSIDGERLVQHHLNELVREAEGTVDAFRREFGSRELEALGESELEAFAERYAPSSPTRPEFENFLGKWAKKLARGVAKVAKTVGSVAAKLGLGPILAKAAALVRPLLNRVLKFAIGKLPASLRPIAQQLAGRLPGAGGTAAAAAPTASAAADAAAPAADGGAVQEPVEAGASGIQQELDQQLAQLFTSSDELELELETSRARSDAQDPGQAFYAELDQAREQLIDSLAGLREGEDAAPHIQQFIPAILPVLKLGIRIAGRERVKRFLAGFLGKVIGKLVGPANTPALSNAIVDAGLKLLTLEVSREDEARAGAAAVAATVEETVRRVSALPDYVLDNQELLEGFALEAFEQSAAANLPPLLPSSVYRERPDLVESQGMSTTWVMLPLRKRRRYKKCARVFKVRITPHVADEVESFEGPLSDYLHDQLGAEEGAELEAEVHLYEALPGTTLGDIARGESEVGTAGPGAVRNVADLHPLTPSAAGMLLGEPRLGRHMPHGTGRHRIGVGQRLYRLSIPGKRLLSGVGRNGRSQARKSGGLRVTLDFAKNEIRILLLMSEVKAQRLAVRLRQQSHAGTVAAGFARYIARRLPHILRGERPGRTRIIHAGLAQGDALGAALRRLPPDVTAALTARLQESLVTAFGEFVKSQAQRLISATEDPADGITLKFTIARPAGLEHIGKALVPGGQATGVLQAVQAGGKPETVVDITPGHKAD